MNQELYETMYKELKEIKMKENRLEEYIKEKKVFIKKYIDHKEEFIEVIKALHMCIADGIVLGACIGAPCGGCYNVVYKSLLVNINKITDSERLII